MCFSFSTISLCTLHDYVLKTLGVSSVARFGLVRVDYLKLVWVLSRVLLEKVTDTMNFSQYGYEKKKFFNKFSF